MAQTITYEGESPVAVDALFKELLNPEHESSSSSHWLIEVELDDGESFYAYLTGCERDDSGYTIATLDVVDALQTRLGEVRKVSTDEICHVTVP